ncbi:2-haloacid dehalogenase [Anoxybacillus vitaminiphilus]|uniref:2-haloacid dehalogenase n=1 Tax=Paranoxybacillus vitaminiphilus TaxID=581036 RepID=A0A327YDA4_9BACL|nr:haloacid dehalogenase type II [Anoxybacillus vitaminiphilus]RAK18854.1 2-haloacid dehalogenase [Anoxybacillus vitaminiphilus]
MVRSVEAFVFDVYGTLFDVYSVQKACEECFPGKGEELCKIWRQKQLEYSFLRQLMGRYRTFLEVTKDALRYTCKKLRVSLDNKKEEKLINAYLQLTPYKEVQQVLKELDNKTLAIFSNGSRDMLEPLVNHYEFGQWFHHVISVDDMKQFKPTPASYMLVLDRLKVNREDVLFISSNTWDIAGAKSFGFYTAWINRTGEIMDELGIWPDCIYSDLTEILEWK